MAYNFSKGRQIVGDLSGSDDSGRDTGIDFEDDYIGFHTSGSARMVLSGSRIGIGTTSPEYRLQVAGNIGVNQYIYHNGDSNTYLNFLTDRFKINVGGINYIDCDDSTSAPHNLTINDGGNNVDFIIKGNGSNAGDPLFKTDASTGRVGINGVGSPDYELDVAGDIGLNEYIYHNGDDDTYIRFEDDELSLAAGGRTFINLQESSTDKLVINNGGLDIDLQVKGESDTNLIRTDAANDRVGIGTSAAIAKLDVSGNIAITAESSTPSQPSDGQGYLYSKSDGKIYWRSYDVSETDLTAGGGGSPGGPDGAVQINDNSSLTGSSGFTFDGSTVFMESTLQVVGEEKLNDSSYSTGEQANRSFTLRKHYNVSISANTLTDIITFRPYLEGTTDDPTGVLHAAVSYRMEIAGLQNGVANGYRSRKGFISYEGSSAANDYASDTTLGSGAITAAVDRSGWVTKLQINANSGGSSGFRGTVFLEIHFPRGGGSNGESIFWSIT